MDNWNIVSEHGNPQEEGVYDVVLIYHGWDKVQQKPTDELFADCDSRWFGPAGSGWEMKGQPKEGLVWHEETGSSPDEQVYAWLPRRVPHGLKLPDGVKWFGEKEG